MEVVIEPEWLTVSGAVHALSVGGVRISESTVRRFADAGRLPTVRATGRIRLFRRGDVSTLLQQLRECTVTRIDA